MDWTLLFTSFVSAVALVGGVVAGVFAVVALGIWLEDRWDFPIRSSVVLALVVVLLTLAIYARRHEMERAVRSSVEEVGR